MGRPKSSGRRNKKPARPELTRTTLLEYFGQAAYEPVAQRELLHRMQVPAELRPQVRRWIRQLLDDGQLVKISRGRLSLPLDVESVEGRLQRHKDGFGFVIPENGEDVFIPRRHLGDAMSGDRVVAQVTGRGRGLKLSGRIVRTVERRARTILGAFEREGRHSWIRPFDPSVGELVTIAQPRHSRAKPRDVVEVRLTQPARYGRAPQGEITEILGHLDDPGIEILIVTRRFGLDTEVPARVIAAADELPSRIGPKQKRGRRRFDRPAPITIDGETAQDFDDAIAVQRRAGGGFRLYVHIADVAHFATEGGVLDEEARSRGTSVYFPGTVLPMFPEKLSNDLCSLRPGVDRLVQSVIMDIDNRGKLIKTEFADGVIRSAARLTYTQVAPILEGQPSSPGVPKRLIPMLRTAESLRQALSERRRRRGSLDFDLPEPELLLDVEGAVTGIKIEPRNKAHLLVEECMLAANEAVAGFLEDRDWPCMYRVHPTPDPLKLEGLAEFVQSLGYRLPDDPESIDGPAINRLLAQVDGRPEADLITQVALRSMQQARYSMQNSGHFGLAAPTYCHFTSPIRRYPDLVVHRLLRLRRRRGEAPTQADFHELATHCSERERNAETAERELLGWKKISLIRDRVGEEFNGVVTGVTRFGLFVQLTENLVEGLIRSEWLGEETFMFHESRLELKGLRSGRCFRLGDRLRVRVDRVDRVLRRVDFSLAETTNGDAPDPISGPKRAETTATAVRRRRRRRGNPRTRGKPRRR